MNWEPARADHSIERATASIALATPLDANTFDELIVAGRKAAAAHSLYNTGCTAADSRGNRSVSNREHASACAAQTGCV